MSKPYPQVYEGEEITMPEKYFMACCDCHLVHELRFKVVKGKVVLAAWRDSKKTASLRRHRGIPISEKARK